MIQSVSWIRVVTVISTLSLSVYWVTMNSRCCSRGWGRFSQQTTTSCIKIFRLWRTEKEKHYINTINVSCCEIIKNRDKIKTGGMGDSLSQVRWSSIVEIYSGLFRDSLSYLKQMCSNCIQCPPKSLKAKLKYSSLNRSWWEQQSPFSLPFSFSEMQPGSRLERDPFTISTHKMLNA